MLSQGLELSNWMTVNKSEHPAFIATRFDFWVPHVLFQFYFPCLGLRKGMKTSTEQIEARQDNS